MKKSLSWLHAGIGLALAACLMGAASKTVMSTGAETIAGIKTFSSAPVMSGASITAATIPDTALATISTAGKVSGASISAGTVPDTALATIATAGKVSDSALSSNVALYTATANPFTGTMGGHTELPVTSTATPITATYTLPAQGIWVLSVVAKVNGSLDHMLTARFWVGWSDQTNDLLFTEQIGTTQKVTGSSFNLTTLTASAPTTAGAITLSAAWTAGSNHTGTFEVYAIKANSYF